MNPPRRARGAALDRLTKLMAPADVEMGLVIDNRYEIRNRLARGGMGEVLAAYDRRLDRMVAMKVTSISGGEWKARFELEMKTLTRLEHPGVVPIYDQGTLPDGRLYYTMKFVFGRTLKERIAGRDDLDRLLSIVAAVAEIVQHAHDRGVIHRDLKPENIMIDEQNAVYVLDWGIARVRQEIIRAEEERRGPVAPGLTSAGTIMGTIEYMSPEQARGEIDTLDARSDVYSLGTILYEILTGSAPVTPSGTLAMLKSVQTARVRPPRELNPSIPADLEELCLKALEPDPAHRYPSAAALAAAIRRTRARRPSSPRAIRKRWAIPLGAAVVVVLALFLLGRRDSGNADDRSRRVEQMRRLTDTQWEAALALHRAGSPRAIEPFAKATEAACREILATVPDFAEAHYRLGRIYGLQRRTDEALAELDLVPDLGRYERGLLRARKCTERMDEARLRWRLEEAARFPMRTPVSSWREFEDETAREWRRKAEEDLRDLDLPMARAVTAWATGRRSDAKRLFQLAANDPSTGGEPYEWLTRMAVEDDESPAWIEQGLERDRGSLSLLVARGDYDAAIRAWGATEPLLVGRILLNLDEDTPDVDALFQLAPDRDLPFYLRGLRRLRRRLFSDAIGDFDAALRLPPGREGIWFARGKARLSWAVAKSRRGEDSTDLYARAIEDADEAIRRNPSRDANRALLVRALIAAESFPRAASECERIQDRTTRAFFWFRRGLRQKSKGEDPSESFRKAVADAESLRLRGAVYLEWGAELEARGKESAATYRRALQDLEDGPNDESTLRKQGRGRLCLGEIPAAVADFEEAARLISRWLGDWESNADYPGDLLEEDPLEEIDRSIAKVEEAIVRAPARDDLLGLQGLLTRIRGRILDRRGRDPSESYQRSLRNLDEAIRLKPGCAAYWRGRGELAFCFGLLKIRHGSDPSDYFQDAVANFDKAVAMEPVVPANWVLRADARAAWLAARKGEGADLYKLAQADYREAVRLAPFDPEPYLRRGRMFRRMEAWTPAAEDFEQAVKLDPTLKPMLEAAIRECRGRK